MRAGRGRAARRARGGDGHVRGQPQHQRLQRLHRGVRVLRLRPGQALAGRLRARRARSSRAACTRRWSSARRELCIQSGIHPDWSLEDYLGWLRFAKRTAAAAGCDIHLHAYSPDGDRAHVRHLRSAARARSSRACATPASARRRAPRPRCCTTACANGSPPTSCRSRAGWRSSRPRTPRACARRRR